MVAKDMSAFDLVFSDIIMPGMNGVDLATIIRDKYLGCPSFSPAATTAFSPTMRLTASRLSRNHIRSRCYHASCEVRSGQAASPKVHNYSLFIDMTLRAPVSIGSFLETARGGELRCRERLSRI
jgi:CheY-like chemotaxis protein